MESGCIESTNPESDAPPHGESVITADTIRRWRGLPHGGRAGLVGEVEIVVQD
jgi:hypothetical protein